MQPPKTTVSEMICIVCLKPDKTNLGASSNSQLSQMNIRFMGRERGGYLHKNWILLGRRKDRIDGDRQ